MSEKLNCEAGKLAIVVGGKHNLGKVLTTIRIMDAGEVIRAECGKRLRNGGSGAVWIVDRPIKWGLEDGSMTFVRCMYDSYMRKLRDDDGVDEMIQRAGLPGTVDA